MRMTTTFGAIQIISHGFGVLLFAALVAMMQESIAISHWYFAVFAGFGYGLMYFPMWGIIAGWVNQHYSSTATMQINGIGMVTFGLGGALANLIAVFI